MKIDKNPQACLKNRKYAYKKTELSKSHKYKVKKSDEE